MKLYTDIRDTVTKQAISSVTDISELNQDSVSRSIMDKKTLLETFAINLSKRKNIDRTAILKEMNPYVSTYGLYSMGILSEDMRLYLTDGAEQDVADWPQFQEAWDDAFHISASYMPANGGEYAVNLLSYPVIYDDRLQYVIIAGCYSKDLTARMNFNSMGGKSYSFLLDSDGKVVIYPKKYENESYVGLMSYINEQSEMIPHQDKDTYFFYNGDRYYAHFEQIKINGWYLMTCAKEQDVFADANTIINGVFVGMGILWLLLLSSVASVFYSIYHAKRELRKAVFYDKLLNIGNDEFLTVFFQKLPEEEFTQMSLTVFDIDKFKEFNYIYGEDCGDSLLRYIVQVVLEEMPEEYLFRYLSDHFVVLVHCKDQKEFAEKFERVLHRFAEDIDAGRIQPFDISAGVRRMHAGDTFRRIMSDALIAKGTVKGIQVQQYAYYDEAILQRRMSFMEMESDFSRALRDREFQVYYQPKYDMKTRAVIGAEALVRWVKADGTIIFPGAFIPCFEASRQIIMLDEAMLEEVCRQMKQMEEIGLPVKIVSVNLSRVHLKNHGILAKIERIIREAGVDPEKLSFEITESALYEDSIPLKQIVDFLHGLGCKVDMDDYGVGVSGPNALASNAFDMVKLDKSFIDRIGDQRMESVICSTIQLSKTLGMEILAEGVEEKYQAERLLEWGCTLAQGFYYSRPIPEKEYRRLLYEEKIRLKKS